MKRKIFLSFLCVVSALLITTGCNKNNDVDKMVGYMNEKYADDSFTFQKVYGGSLGDNQTKIIVSSEQYPNKDIYVICTDSNVCTDNYLGVKYEENTRNYLKNKLRDAFGSNFYLDYEVDDTACTENGSSNTTFEEYIADEYSGIYFEAIVGYDINSSTEDTTLNKIKTTFSNATISANIFFVNENIESSDYDIYDEFVACIQNKQYNKRLFLIKDDVNTYSTIKWITN